MGKALLETGIENGTIPDDMLVPSHEWHAGQPLSKFPWNPKP